MQRLKRAIKKMAAIGTGMAMLGATITSAVALDLADYPSPFVVGGTYDTSNAIVVGAQAAASDTLGAVDIATNLQYESKVCTSSGTSVTVTGGISEDIPLGKQLATESGNELETLLQDDDIESLLDTTITFKSADYDVSEVVAISANENSSVKPQTSLTSSDDDYETGIFLEAERDSMKYFYSFDETINLSTVSSSDPLKIDFLGKTIKLTSIDTGGAKFTAYVGDEFYMNVDDEVTVEGKIVKLLNVGSGGSVKVDVGGTVETISAAGTETVNGVEITNDETFYDANDVAQRSATLIMGKDASETYKDGDAYVGEDTDDPDWVWNIAGLYGQSTTTIVNNESTGISETGIILGVENDFVKNDDSDNPVKAGECYTFPNNYIEVCLESLTIADDNYMRLVIELDTSTDLSDAGAGASLTSEPSIYIHVDESEGIVLDQGDLQTQNGTASDRKTDKIWLYLPGTGGATQVYYEDTNNKMQFAGNATTAGPDTTIIAHLDYQDVTTNDVRISVTGNGSTGLNVTVIPFDTTDLSTYTDNITAFFDVSAGKIDSLGATASTEEAHELIWNLGNIGTKDEDHRTKYGIKIYDPKSNGASDEVVLDIPGDMVKANIAVKGTTSTTSTGGESCTVADITPETKLSNEVSTPTAYNLVLVGGPCANPLADSVGGAKCDTWALASGEALIKLVANGDKVAMLVAGTDAIDTRMAAKVIANYADYTLSGEEVTITGTLSSPTVKVD